MTFKEFRELQNLQEKVSPDCSTGAGELPPVVGPWKDFVAIRTNHLDDIRPPSSKERDAGFDCQSFDHIIKALFRKRPLGLAAGKYQLAWKNKKGYQTGIVSIDTNKKTITWITIMQLNKKRALDYHPKPGDRLLDLGMVNEPN